MTQIWSLLSDRFIEYISRNVRVKSWVIVIRAPGLDSAATALG